MPFTLHGRHFVAGERIAPETPDLVDAAAQAAEAAFWSYGACDRHERAAFLEAIAEEIDARAEAITTIAARETGLPEARLVGERARTTGQLRLFAAHVAAGAHLDRRHDPALPDRQPLPRPDLRLMQRPVGPVAVFGASNFPLAFSVAGGDTASALAAGCPVVVRGHWAHPGTGEIVAEAVCAAVVRRGLHSGVFSLIQGRGDATGAALVRHPLIRAVGFTGSLAGGRALFDLCVGRPEPIPFFGELGSINPMFLLPVAAAARGAAIGAGWAGSLALGVGQFCTKPGLAVVLAGPESDAFAEAARGALARVGPQVMLTDGVAAAYRRGRDRIAATAGVERLLEVACEGREGAPSLFRVAGRDWAAASALAEEVFGPLGLIVTVESVEEMRDLARGLAGQLTATLQMEPGDAAAARALLPVLERKAGRLLANGFPTGVEVADAMVHGGPYPASTNFGATSVGTLAIRRWLRPVCLQDIPADLLAADMAADMAG